LAHWRPLKASTRLRYTKSLLKLLRFYAPKGLQDTLPTNTFFLELRAAKRAAATEVETTKRAVPADGRKLEHAWRTCPARTCEQAVARFVAALLFVSASRFSDITRATSSVQRRGRQFVLCIPVHKGAPLGGDVRTKFLRAKGLQHHLRHVKRNWGKDPLEEINRITATAVTREIRRADPSYTTHSLRRGAVTELASRFPLADIALLTLHGNRSARTTALYNEFPANTPAARLQRRMSRKLDALLR
jgi:hypothetical protein